MLLLMYWLVKVLIEAAVRIKTCSSEKLQLTFMRFLATSREESEKMLKAFCATACLLLFILIHPALGQSKRPGGWKRSSACGVIFYRPPELRMPYKGQIGLH